MALLEIYRDGNVMFDQPVALGELYVRWVGSDDEEAIMREIDEFDTTIDEFAVEEVQQFREAADWVADNE